MPLIFSNHYLYWYDNCFQHGNLNELAWYAFILVQLALQITCNTMFEFWYLWLPRLLDSMSF